MKKILLPIIILLTLMVTSCGTSKKFDYRNKYTDEVLDGIFKLRLGMSVAELKAIVDTTLLKSEEIAEYYEKKEIFNGRLKEFRLEQYTPADNHVIKDIRLKFFDDKLYDISVLKYNGKTENLLTKKYGEPKIKKVKYKAKGEYTVETPSNLRTSIWDEFTTERWTNTIKYENLIWATNAENITCYYSDNKILYIKNKDAREQISAEFNADQRRLVQEGKDREAAEKKANEQLLDEF